MNRLKKSFHIVLALFLILIGIVGLILPVLNGVVFLLLGLILLSFESPYIEFQLQKQAHKNAFVGRCYEKLNDWMRKVFRQ